MYIDKRSEFSSAHTLAATGAGQNSIDLGSDRDIGPGTPMFLVAQISAIDAASANETYVLDLQTDDSDAFGSPTTIGTITIPRTSAVGSRFVLGFPYGNERFLRINLTLGGTTPSITYSAWLTDKLPTAWQAYPDAI